MRTGIWFEFLIERDYMYLLEIDPDVKSYQSQPRRQIATALPRAIPDFFFYKPFAARTSANSWRPVIATLPLPLHKNLFCASISLVELPRIRFHDH